MKTALIAGVPDTIELYQRALQPTFDSIVCLTLAQVKQVPFSKLDLILCEVSFDRGSMPVLLNRWKNDPAGSRVPFVAIHGSRQPWPLLELSLEYAKNYGAKGLIDAYAWRTNLGDEAARENIHMFMLGLLTFPKNDFWHVGDPQPPYSFHRT